MALFGSGKDRFYLHVLGQFQIVNFVPSSPPDPWLRLVRDSAIILPIEVSERDREQLSECLVFKRMQMQVKDGCS